MATTAKLKFDFGPYLERLAEKAVDIDAAVDRAAKAGAEVLQKGMQRRVAVLTGELQDHITIDGPKVDGNHHAVEVGIIRSKGVDGKLARKANAQEYGTSSMPAHPYVRPTVVEDRAQAIKAIKASLKQDGMI